MFHFPLISLPPWPLSSIHSPTFLAQVGSSIIKNITNTYTHNYQLAFLVSSIQTPILARIGHLIFSLSNFKYQSWPGLVTWFFSLLIANTNPGQDWSPDVYSLPISNTNPGQDWSPDFHFTFLCNTTHFFFNTLTDFFLVPQVSASQKFFTSPSFPWHDLFLPYTHWLFLAPSIINTYTYSLSTSLFSLLNSNTNPGQDWSPDFTLSNFKYQSWPGLVTWFYDFHFTFLSYSSLTSFSLSLSLSYVTLIYNLAQKSYTPSWTSTLFHQHSKLALTAAIFLSKKGSHPMWSSQVTFQLPTNPGQDWSHHVYSLQFHILMLLFCHICVTLIYNFPKNHTPMGCIPKTCL